jgi:hypothetical protein
MRLCARLSARKNYSYDFPACRYVRSVKPGVHSTGHSRDMRRAAELESSDWSWDMSSNHRPQAGSLNHDGAAE